MPGPQEISEFYLSAVLDSIKQSGYTIFVVRGGALPIAKRTSVKDYQFYPTVKELENFAAKNKNRQLHLTGSSEKEDEVPYN